MNEELTKEQKKKTDTILGSVIVVGAVVVGYRLGIANTEKRISKGLAKVFNVNPKLNKELWDAMKIVVQKETES